MTSLSFFSVILLLLFGLPSALCSWLNLRSGGSGPGTVYGYGQNSKGSCSYGKNMANTAGLPWSNAPSDASDGGTGLKTTYIALNKEDLAGGTACGSCIWFRGTGAGIGVEGKEISSKWQYGVVDNVCPECEKGALDLARSYEVGDGIWNVEWHAVPCQVGDSKLNYNFPLSSPYYFNMVVSNGRVPVKAVTAMIDGNEVALTRTSNNQWAYHNSAGPFKFPLELKVTPICGESVSDIVDSLSGGFGGAQFGRDGCPSEGNPVSGASSPNDFGGLGTGSLSVESVSATRAVSNTDKTESERRLPDMPSEQPAQNKSNSPVSTPKPTAPEPTTSESATPEPTAPEPTTSEPMAIKPVASDKPRHKNTSTESSTSASNVEGSFGGEYSKTLRKIVLPAWYQCGNFYGRYPNTVCGKEGFDCVKITNYYMQCRSDDGKTANKHRRLLQSTDH